MYRRIRNVPFVNVVMSTFESSTAVSINLLDYLVTQMICDLCTKYLCRINDQSS